MADTPLRRRIDQVLVERGIFDTRARAQAAIAQGYVEVAGRRIARASELVAPDAAITARPAHAYVSRGGVKLAHALDHFAIDPTGRVCLDVGASTGGFTQVLVQRGAALVYAVDVGHGQLHASLHGDPRIASLEGVDARRLTRDEIPQEPSLLVCDASFISAAAVLARPLELLTQDAEVVVLIKPQFEAGRGRVGKGGIVKDEAALAEAVDRIRAFLAAAGFAPSDPIESPITGGDGNREFLVAARRPARQGDKDDHHPV